MHAERGGQKRSLPEGPGTQRGTGTQRGPGVQNCRDRMQNYGLRKPLAYLEECHCAMTHPPPI